MDALVCHYIFFFVFFYFLSLRLLMYRARYSEREGIGDFFFLSFPVVSTYSLPRDRYVHVFSSPFLSLARAFFHYLALTGLVVLIMCEAC